jgi:hypothetical protein
MIGVFVGCDEKIISASLQRRQPQIANEALSTWTCVPRVARAVQRRRPRIAAGSALVVAGAVARLRAAAAEPLR